MYITDIHIKNIQCFEDVTILINKNEKPCLWNVILGDNSSGKSCLLRCIAIGLRDPSSGATLMKSLGVDFLRDKDKIGIIEITLIDYQSNEECLIRTEITQVYDTEIISQKVVKGSEDKLWKKLFLCGYGIQRSGEADTSYSKYKPVEPVITLFDYNHALQNIELIFRRQPEDIQNLLLGMLMKILRLDEINATLELTNKGMIFIIDGIEVLLDAVGDGFSGTVAWITDFIGWQTYADRLKSAKDVKDLSGILLLDEIELTLHPSLQRYIVKNLKDHFPKVQFIITSHSPIIAAGAADFQNSNFIVFRIESGKTKVIDNIPSIRGMRFNQILSSIAFDFVPTASPGNIDDMDRFSELICKERNAKEEKEYQQLMARLEDTSQFGETEFERHIEKAVSETLENMLNSKPTKELELLMKNKLNKLFNFKA